MSTPASSTTLVLELISCLPTLYKTSCVKGSVSLLLKNSSYSGSGNSILSISCSRTALTA